MGVAVGVATLLRFAIYCIQVPNLLIYVYRATVHLLREGVVMLPTDVMALHGLSPSAFLRDDFASSLRALAKDLCKVRLLLKTRAQLEFLVFQIIELHSTSARAQTLSIDAALRPALLSAGIRVDHVLECLKNTEYNLFVDTLQRPSPFVATKMWWRYKRRRF